MNKKVVAVCTDGMFSHRQNIAYQTRNKLIENGICVESIKVSKTGFLIKTPNVIIDGLPNSQNALCGKRFNAVFGFSGDYIKTRLLEPNYEGTLFDYVKQVEKEALDDISTS